MIIWYLRNSHKLVIPIEVWLEGWLRYHDLWLVDIIGWERIELDRRIHHKCIHLDLLSGWLEFRLLDILD